MIRSTDLQSPGMVYWSTEKFYSSPEMFYSRGDDHTRHCYHQKQSAVRVVWAQHVMREVTLRIIVVD